MLITVSQKASEAHGSTLHLSTVREEIKAQRKVTVVACDYVCGNEA
jgi:hypothetical protein